GLARGLRGGGGTEEARAGRRRPPPRPPQVQDLLAAGEADDALRAAKAFEKKYPGDPEGREVAAIAEHLMGARDEILARVERLLSIPGREREASRLAQVALRILPGDPKAAALLAKARSPGHDTA